MKTISTFLLMILGLSLVICVSGQDYKHPYGSIQEDGKVLSPDGKHLGWVTKEGIIKDSTGLKVAHVDSEGNLVNATSGKKIGKVQKNGNYVSHYAKTSDKGWTVASPMNGTCDVKNEKGETVVKVHESYKQFGACAYHCLSMKKQGKEMKMEK